MSLAVRIVPPRYKLIFFLKKHFYIERYIEKNYGFVLEKYIHENAQNKDKEKVSKIIWVFWWQGIESAPAIVKKCVESVCQHKGEGVIVICLHKDNYKKYVDIPDYIMDKVTRTISLTAFSDILRFSLLNKYGGWWLDATILLTADIPSELWNIKLFSNRIPTGKNNFYVSQNRWSGFFIGGSPNVLFNVVNDLFLEYYKQEDYVINYFLADYFIDVAYKKIKEVKALTDQIPYNNVNIHKLEFLLNQKFEYQKFNSLCENTFLHKLSYKHLLSERTKEGELTNYGYILNLL